MKGLFNPDSKIMTALSALGDFLILNILFLICCLPVFTIGAAQAGMFTAMRVQADPEDDSSVIKAYFRGFANGFGTISLVTCIELVLMGAAGFSTYILLSGATEGNPVFLWCSLVGMFICCLFQPLPGAFHSRFRCSVWQLLRNSWLLFLAQPFRCIPMAVLIWSPVLIFVISLKVFLMMAPVFFGVYFSLMYWLSFKLLKKPFQKLEQMYLEQPEKAE